jgi:magnesium chelatase subunit I
VAFEARTDRRIDKRSGVSQRMPITVMENVISNAERRAIVAGDTEVVPRISDIYAALPAITGKMELEYEGELVGAPQIARELIRRAADATFQERAGGVNVDDVVMWFDEGGALQVSDDARAEVAVRGFEAVPELLQLVSHVGLSSEGDASMAVAACELVLEALVARKKVSRSDVGQYARATPEPRRRPQDPFGGGMS